MPVFTIEEAAIRALQNDSTVQSILGSNYNKKIFMDSLRPQLSENNSMIRKYFPNISIDINYGEAEPTLPAMHGVCTIMMEFFERELDGIPTKFSDLSLLKERILVVLGKVDFSTGGLVVNHFLLISQSEPFFNLEDKVWRWPLIFEFVHEDIITIGRAGFPIPLIAHTSGFSPGYR